MVFLNHQKNISKKATEVSVFPSYASHDSSAFPLHISFMLIYTTGELLNYNN
jgi:hypothetical protein